MKKRLLSGAIFFYLALVIFSNQIIQEEKRSIGSGSSSGVIWLKNEYMDKDSISEEILYVYLDEIYNSVYLHGENPDMDLLVSAISDSLSDPRVVETPIQVIGSDIYALMALKLSSSDIFKAESVSVFLKDPIFTHDSHMFGNKDLNIALMRIRSGFRTFWYYILPHFGLIPDKSALLIDKVVLESLDESEIMFSIADDLPVTVLHCGKRKMGAEIQNWINSQDNVSFSEICGDLSQDQLQSLSDNASDEYVSSEDNNSSIPVSGFRSLASVFFMIVLISLANEDLAIMGAGLLVSQGMISFGFGLFCSLSGIFMGDLAIYFLGSGIGIKALNTYPVKWFLSPKQVRQTGKWFRRRGQVLLIISRFIPGSRFPIYFSAGLMNIDKRVFLKYFGITTLLWTPVFMGISYLLGDAMIRYFGIYRDRIIWAAAIILLIIGVIYAVSTRFLKKKVYDAD